MTFLDALSLRPTSRAREVRLDPRLLEQLPGPAPEPPRAPLPLAAVLRGVDALRRELAGTGLMPSFDLYGDYLIPARVAARAR